MHNDRRRHTESHETDASLHGTSVRQLLGDVVKSEMKRNVYIVRHVRDGSISYPECVMNHMKYCTTRVAYTQ